MDRSGVIEPQMPPSLQQMFTLAMKCVRSLVVSTTVVRYRTLKEHQAQTTVRRLDQEEITPRSSGQMGHTQVRCPKPDQALPFRPDGWNSQPEGPRRRTDGPQQGNGT